MIAYLAGTLERPVRWIESRREALVASLHGRAERVELAVGYTQDGKITAVKGRVILDKGADQGAVSNGTALVTAAVITGAYAIQSLDFEATGFVCNRTPTGAYRGFGQPEANFALERCMHIAARKLGLDPAEVRKRNLVDSQHMPYSVPTGLVLDSGHYVALLDMAMNRFDYAKAQASAARARGQGRLVGVGMAFYTEVTNFSPSWLTKLLGIETSGFDTASIRMEPTGHVQLFISQTLMGQGLEVAVAQVCADELDISFSDVIVVANDTQTGTFTGYASGASRGAGVCGSCAALVSRRLAARLRKWGAHLLELPAESVVLERGSVRSVDDPAVSVTLRNTYPIDREDHNDLAKLRKTSWLFRIRSNQNERDGTAHLAFSTTQTTMYRFQISYMGETELLSDNRVLLESADDGYLATRSTLPGASTSRCRQVRAHPCAQSASTSRNAQLLYPIESSMSV